MDEIDTGGNRRVYPIGTIRISSGIELSIAMKIFLSYADEEFVSTGYNPERFGDFSNQILPIEIARFEQMFLTHRENVPYFCLLTSHNGELAMLTEDFTDGGKHIILDALGKEGTLYMSNGRKRIVILDLKYSKEIITQESDIVKYLEPNNVLIV